MNKEKTELKLDRTPPFWLPCHCVLISFDDSEPRSTIRQLMYNYQDEFVDQFSIWDKYLKSGFVSIDYCKKSLPESFKAYSKTGLFCSPDILSSVLYDQKLRDELEELVELYDWKKVVMIICEEAKKMEILN